MSPSRRRAIGAVRGLASRAPHSGLLARTLAPSPRSMPAPRPCSHPSRALAPRAPSPCPVAVGRDVPIAPPRHRRGARLGIPPPSRGSRCGRARCPHRAAAPSARCVAWLPAPRAACAVEPFKIERSGSHLNAGPLCSYPSRPFALCASLCSKFPRTLAPSPRSTPAPRPCPARTLAVPRCGRARCLAATARGGSPPSRLAPPRRIARGGSPPPPRHGK